MTRKIVVSGMRATGKMHLGHYFGALKNWIELQDKFDCFFFVADWHGLLSEFKDASRLKADGIEMVRDWLACGLDPDKCTIFVQSEVRQHAELFLVLAPFVPVGWLERSPTYKDQVDNLGKEVANYGFFGYPILQTADIVLYKGECVPVGEDQVSHLEICREITRRFNQFYPDTFPEPQALLTKVSKLLGTDRRKMSKSYGNAIELNWDAEQITAKAKTMITDPKRVKLKDPGHPDECNVFTFYQLMGQSDEAAAREWCETAAKGCMDCKVNLAGHLDKFIDPIRERRKQFSDDLILDILQKGREKAAKVAQETMSEILGKFKMA